MLLRCVVVLSVCVSARAADKPSPAAQALAHQMAGAASDAERDQLVARHPELADVNLRRAFADEILALFYQGHYPWVMSLSQYLQGLAPRLHDPEGVVVGHLWPGNVHTEQGDYDQALAEYHKCIELATPLNYTSGLTAAWNGVAIVEQRRGDYRASIEHYQLCLRQAEIDGDKERIAEVLSNIGVVDHESGDYRKSLELYDRIRGMVGNDPAWDAYLLANTGAVYYSEGDYELAAEMDRKAAKLLDEQHNERETVTALDNLAEAQSAMGQYREAAATLKETLPRAERLGVKAVAADIWLDLGEIGERLAHYTEAREACSKALSIREGMGNKPGMSEALSCLAQVALSRRDYRAALDSAERAAGLARQCGDDARLWEPLLEAGQAEMALHQLDKAAGSFGESAAVVEAIRGRIAGGERQSQAFFEGKVAPYYALVELMLRQGRPEDALAWAERAKARVLQDVLAEGRSPVAQQMSPEENERERLLTTRLAGFNNVLYEQNRREHPDPAAVAQAGSSLEAARRELEGFQATLYVRHPELKTLRGEMAPLTAAQMDELLPDKRTALLEYVTAEQRTYLFVRSAGRLRVYSIPLGRRALGERVAAFRRKLSARSALYRADAEALYRLLLEPATMQLADRSGAQDAAASSLKARNRTPAGPVVRGFVNNLIIAPDGPLWDLPFQALLSPAGRHVIEDRAVSYVPSFAVLREMRQRRGSEPNVPTPLTLLAMGNPALGAARSAPIARNLHDRQALDPLPDAEDEVKAIGRLFGSSASEVLTGAAAREALFKSDAPKARILHLATHGILDNASPLYSYLVLSQENRQPGEDGLLEAWEIMQMNLHARLAVLSACETARGRIRPGEGVIGLSWALFVAGVPTAVVSQWKVESSGTEQLMLAFYRQWKSGASPARALQAASLRLLKDPRYRHPFFWAPFVAVGNATEAGLN